MANETEVKLVLTAEDNVSSAIKKVIEALGTTGLGQAVTAASTGFLALKGAAEVVAGAFNAVSEQFAKAIEEASKMEATNRKLSLALMNTGEFSKESFDRIVEWSDGVEKATGMSNEAALELVILAKNFGMTAEESQKAAQAALDLSAATGIDANSALRQLNNTLSGVSGRLGKMVPELDSLTQSQLKSGAAIDLIASKYKDFAAQTANTFSGAQKKLGTAIDNVYEAFGRVIVQNPLIIGAMEGLIDTFNAIAQAVDATSSFILDNADLLKEVAIAFGITAAAIGVYTVAMNFSAIATTAATIATIAFNSAMALTPWGLAALGIAAVVAGLTAIIHNWDTVVAATKIAIGTFIQVVAEALAAVTDLASGFISLFSPEIANKINAFNSSIQQYGKSMQDAGEKQLAAARATKEQGSAADAAANSIKGLEAQASAATQAMVKLKSEYSKALADAQDAFKALKDLTPRIALEKFKEDAALWDKSIKDLQVKANAYKVSLVGSFNAEDQKNLAETNRQIANAAEAAKALKIKVAQTIREMTLKEVDIQLDVERRNSIAVADEIMLKKLDGAKSLRDQLVNIESERLLAEAGFADADVRAGISRKQAAILQANQIELTAYKAGLDAQVQLAVSTEIQKAQALSDIRSKVASGLGGATTVNSNADAQIIAEKVRQDQITALVTSGNLTRVEGQRLTNDSMLAMQQASVSAEIALNDQRIQALGLTEEGLAERLQKTQTEYELQQEMLNNKYANELLTDAQFNAAKEDLENAHIANMNSVESQFYNDQAARNEALGNDWEASFNRIEAAYAKHGDNMRTLQAVTQTEQFQGLKTAFGNTAALMQTHNKKAFAIGKAASIAQATISTFESAVKAFNSLAGIPIVGPGLGAAAAAAAVTAGVVQINNIKSQEMQGGQADQGMDFIPQSLSGKSFVVSGGERIVQPEANKSLTAAVDTINKGGSAMTANISITINGTPSSSDIAKMKDAVIDAIRQASEKGQPVINARGIVT